MLAAKDEFLTEAARAAMAAIWPKPAVTALCAAIDQVFSLAESAWSLRRSNLAYALSAPLPACKQGCDWCCRQQVGLSPPEAIRIAAHVRSLPDSEQTALAARLHRQAEQAAGLPTRDRARLRLACAFLDGSGSCGIYAVRPLRCRGVYSIDRDFCQACHDDLDAMKAKLEAGTLKPVFLETPQSIFDSALAGIYQALRKAAPKAVVSLELSASVSALLKDGRLAERWLAGARPAKELALVPG